MKQQWGGVGGASGLTGNKQEAELRPQPPGEGGQLGAEGGIMFLGEESPPTPHPQSQGRGLGREAPDGSQQRRV